MGMALPMRPTYYPLTILKKKRQSERVFLHIRTGTGEEIRNCAVYSGICSLQALGITLGNSESGNLRDVPLAAKYSLFPGSPRILFPGSPRCLFTGHFTGTVGTY